MSIHHSDFDLSSFQKGTLFAFLSFCRSYADEAHHIGYGLTFGWTIAYAVFVFVWLIAVIIAGAFKMGKATFETMFNGVTRGGWGGGVSVV